MKLPNRTGTICKLSGNRRRPYMVRIYTPEGYAVLGYYRLRSEAMTALMTAAAQAPPGLKSPTATLEEVYDQWRTQHAQKVRPEMMHVYATAWKSLKPLASHSIRHISAADVEQSVLFANPKPTVRKVVKSLLSQLYRYAIRHDLASRNIADYIDILVDHDPVIERRPFTFPEVSELFQEDSVFAHIALVGIYSGMRPGELLGLQTNEVDMAAQCFRIAGSKTKSGKNRVIPIHPAILSIISDRLEKAQNSASPWMFVSNRKKPPDISSYGLWLRRYQHTPHDTRHTFATYAHVCGMDPVATKRIMGHSIKDITAGVYTHLDEAFLIRELRKFVIA